jgi:hypothetical protein
VLLDRDTGVAPVAVRRSRKTVALLAAAQGHVANVCDLGLRHDMDDELPRSQARADLEVRFLHEDFFLDVRLRDEEDRRVLLDADRLPVAFLLLDRVEPTLEPRLVCRVRRLREVPEPDPDSWPSAPVAACWACGPPCWAAPTSWPA